MSRDGYIVILSGRYITETKEQYKGNYVRNEKLIDSYGNALLCKKTLDRGLSQASKRDGVTHLILKVINNYIV